MNDAGRLGRGITDMDRPRPHLFHPGGEVGLQAKQAIAGTDQTIQPRLFETEIFEKGQTILVVQIGQLLLDLGANGHHRRALAFGERFQAIQVGVVVETVLEHVGNIHGRLDRQQTQRANQIDFVGRQTHGARSAPLVQMGQQAFEHLDQFLGVLVTRTRLLVLAMQCFLDGRHIRQGQFGDDGLHVGDRVYPARHVNHVLVIETTDHVHDRISLANIGQKLVTQALALRRAGHKARDVYEFDNRRLHALRLDDARQGVQSRIGHLNDTDVRLDGAEGIVFSSDARFGQRVKEGGLAHIGQPDNAALQTHGVASLPRAGRALIFCVATSKAPRAISGQADSARSMAVSMASCSSLRGGFST